MSKVQKLTTSLGRKIAFRVRYAIKNIEDLRYRALRKKLSQKICTSESLDLKPVEPVWSMNLAALSPSLHYKDETWNQVKHLDSILKRKRFNLRNLIDGNECLPTKLSVEGEIITIKSEKKKNNWIYWYSDLNFGSNYVLSFDALVQTEFHEFQIAFLHRSLTDRYRFRVVDNKELVFEVIAKGYFFHEVLSVPLSFTLGQWHAVQLRIDGPVYQFIVDDRVILSVQDSLRWFKNGGLALIFYDWQGFNDIQLSLKNLKVCGSNRPPSGPVESGPA